MRLRRALPAAALLLATAVSSCGGAAASSLTTTPAATAATVAAPAAPAASTRANPKIARLTALARATYANQVHGAHAIDVLHKVGADRTLLNLLQSHQLGAARAYVQSRFPSVWYHWHVSRMRVTQGTQRVIEIGVPFVVAPSQMVLHGSNGRSVGTLQVSMQDEIGITRLFHRMHPEAQVVIRGRNALRSSMYSAGKVKLPASGRIVIAGHRYLVDSFHAQSWDGGPVTVWILTRG